MRNCAKDSVMLTYQVILPQVNYKSTQCFKSATVTVWFCKICYTKYSLNNITCMYIVALYKNVSIALQIPIYICMGSILYSCCQYMLI